MSLVIGLDLSLVSTGIAGAIAGGCWTATIRTSAASGTAFARIRRIRDQVLDHTRNADLVVVEGLAFGSQTGQHLTRAGLWHLVMERVDAAGVPWAEVAPATLKRFATGKGNASKSQVLAAVLSRHGPGSARDDNEADALTLAAMGADHIGEPTVTMPATHRAALEKVIWP